MADKLACQMAMTAAMMVSQFNGFPFPKERTETQTLAHSRVHESYTPTQAEEGKKVNKKTFNE